LNRRGGEAVGLVESADGAADVLASPHLSSGSPSPHAIPGNALPVFLAAGGDG